MDSVNHVLSSAESTRGAGIPVPVETLDGLLDGLSPRLIKIDVEGYETEVLRGASNTLSGPGLLALILELNGSGRRYGYDEVAVHDGLLRQGFTPCLYQPFARKLIPLGHGRSHSGNTLYVKDVEALRERVLTARDFRVQGRVLPRVE